MEWVVLAIILLWFTSKANDGTKWFGYMICISCNYRWTSRRNTPPLKCPHCNSKFIDLLYGSNESKAYKKWLSDNKS